MSEITGITKLTKKDETTHKTKDNQTNERNQGKAIIFDLKNVSFDYPTSTGRKTQQKIQQKNQTHLPTSMVLNNINMQIFKGERLVILGPNGSGKSTLLKILNALILPTNGSITGLGIDFMKDQHDKRKMFDFRKKVGFVFQNPDEELFSPTVYEDIIFGPIHLGFSNEEVKKMADDVINLLGLEHIKDKHPFNLSGGEKKKVAIAAVLSYDPDIIMFDEPTSGLDPKSRSELVQIMNELNEKGKTIITATHDVNAIPDIADRIYILSKNIIESGTTREIFSNIKLLKDTNLEIPEILKLFKVLNAFGYNCEKLPLSIDEAIDQITQTIETDGGHIHLHIHEHTHKRLKALKEDFTSHHPMKNHDHEHMD
ncbi:MAG: energy-coupling factor ABC transporter ATP-binding protein [Promethearchaeota archaeon]